METIAALGKNLNHALLGVHTLGSGHTDPQLCPLLENLLEKMSDHLATLLGLAGLHAGRASGSWTGSGS